MTVAARPDGSFVLEGAADLSYRIQMTDVEFPFSETCTGSPLSSCSLRCARLQLFFFSSEEEQRLQLQGAQKNNVL